MWLRGWGILRAADENLPAHKSYRLLPKVQNNVKSCLSRIDCVCVCDVSPAGADRPQRLQAGLRRPLRRLEFGNHTGEFILLFCSQRAAGETLTGRTRAGPAAHCQFKRSVSVVATPPRSGIVCSWLLVSDGRFSAGWNNQIILKSDQLQLPDALWQQN